MPGRVVSAAVASTSVVMIAFSWWWATRPGAAGAQAGFVRWLNDPPQPLAAVTAATNAFFRPVPLTVVAIALLGWVLLTTAAGATRREVLRALLVAVVLAELLSQALKRLAHQARPTASIPGLDVHGYPKDPLGHAYPSAHTAVAVAVVSGVWPWISWPQRVVGVIVAALVALNRIYIGAHWLLDVLGGLAIGLLCGSACWLVAARWPLRAGQSAAADPRDAAP